jgi:ATPase subunit of ABC transporter with duplicated ATPase domains
MSILTITNLSHTFDDKKLFENANLAVNNGEHTGIVGLNGAGKSTFMNIISGKIIQDGGEVKWTGGVKWGYLDQHADIDRKLTVMQYLEGSFIHLFELNERLEKIYEEMTIETDEEKLDRLINRSSSMLENLNAENFFELENRIKKVANGLGIGNFGYETVIEHLSGGQRAKLMLAGLLLAELDVILLDEPTNFLDIEHIKWLSDYLNSYEGTVLVISHDTEFLNNVTRNIISVENGSIKKYSGNYDKFLAASEVIATQHADSYEKQQQQRKKLEEFIAKNKARAATAGMAKSREKTLNKMDIITKPSVIYPAEFNFIFTDVISKDMLFVDKLEVGYNGKAILPPINIDLKNGTKLWIRGTNGIGKSTLLKTLMGKLPPIAGDFLFSVNAKLLYLEQDLEFLNKEENAVNYLSDCYPRMNIKEVRTCLGKVGIKNDLAVKPISNLSGGEQVKVKLAAITLKSSNFLLLDEPTNHLDINAKESLKTALKQYNGTIILVSHERPFAEDICNDVFDL